MMQRVTAGTLFLFLICVPIARAQQGQISGIWVKPENILFTGNNSISSDELRAIFRNAGTVTAQLSPEGLNVYNSDRISHGLNMLLAFYRNRGFVRAAISGPDTDFAPGESGNRVRLLFKIAEDHLYLLGQVRTSGIKVLDEGILKTMLNIQPGQPLNLAQLNAGVQAIQKTYLSLGYLDIDIQANVDAIEKKKLADVALNVKEGNQYHVGKVELLGNPLINSSLLREFLPLQTGSTFAEKAFEACLQNLNELGITPVLTDADVTFKVDHQKAMVDLEIDLEGKSSRK